MTTDSRKIITINSPPGSGNMFCQYLMRENFNMVLRWVEHEPNLFDPNGLNICLLRNPYAAIASGIEVNFTNMDENHQKIFLKHLDAAIYNSMLRHTNQYNLFLYKSQTLDYVTPVGFNLLTQEPNLFLDKISKKFDIPLKENRVSPDDVKKNMRSVEFLKSRLPREYSFVRKEIDLAVNKYDPIKICYENYAKYKRSIDLSLDI
jgi:hypothetical protein